ncbi:hypothetical protein [Alteromonas gilva]|uniref:Outer membrane protein beta-barrel domain-containing protein n=1 Tax=Alteromonas gilva TaxID=2987522 RepID=A0ABT5L153_9ALTE|nr:hypothetical protein [Alteromonas gilva]MDC8830139.1 hypothetical protein [Alteromonas gilva]
MKNTLLTLALSSTLLSFDSYASERPFLEFGVGIEYGGLGTQIHLPLRFEDVDVYLAAGVFSYSSRTNEEYGFGGGFNYYLQKHHSINLYYGVLNERSYFNERNYFTDQFEVKREQDYGLSLGYKYYFNNRSKSGLTLGATLNVYDDDTYPFFSIGYRY